MSWLISDVISSNFRRTQKTLSMQVVHNFPYSMHIHVHVSLLTSTYVIHWWKSARFYMQSNGFSVQLRETFFVKKNPLHVGMELWKEQKQGRDEITKMLDKRHKKSTLHLFNLPSNARNRCTCTCRVIFLCLSSTIFVISSLPCFCVFFYSFTPTSTCKGFLQKKIP